MKSFFKRSLLLLALLIPFFSVSGLSETIGDPVIRVLLTKIEVTDRVDLTLDGVYSVNGIFFQRGSRVTLAVRNGRIFLYYEGISVDCGVKAVFERHTVVDGRENGIRFNGQYPLHPGTLTVDLKNGSMQFLLSMDVEDYLWGVVPSEMSDSYPLEALKAQAVAARTYVLKKKALSAGTYDVVDNTNDQAYNGVLRENTRSLEAIIQTRGICGVDKAGRLISCYYSASNGGQTEPASHVWGGTDPEYLVTKDDPYDLENKGSTVKKHVIRKVFSDNTQALKDLITAAVIKKNDSVSSPEILEIRSVRLTSPQYFGSKVMTEAEFVLACASGSVASNEKEIFLGDSFAVEETPGIAEVRVVIPVFPDLEAACDININVGSANEIISAEDAGDDILLTSRRFGHAVGMSQRGAQQMAGEYHWTLSQIWDFYYPGTFLRPVRYTRPGTPAPTVDAVFLSTPGPAATPTPRPTLMPIDRIAKEDSVIYIVDRISAGSYLNMRSRPSTVAPVLRQLFYGQKLVLVEETDGLWIRVRTDDCDGYVMKEFVSLFDGSQGSDQKQLP